MKHILTSFTAATMLALLAATGFAAESTLNKPVPGADQDPGPEWLELGVTRETETHQIREMVGTVEEGTSLRGLRSVQFCYNHGL